MKSFKLLEKISSLAGRKNKSTAPGSVFSQQLKQQPHYEARALGKETGRRKKSLRERWRERDGSSPRQEGDLLGRQKIRKISWLRLQLLLLLCLLLCGTILLLKGPIRELTGSLDYFSIHEIIFNGCRETSTKELRTFAEISYQMNMLTLDPQALEERLRGHPWVAAADVRRIWPDGLRIAIKEYQPLALVVQIDDEKLKYMDRKGVVFAPVLSGQELDLPVVTGLDAFHTEEEREQMLDSATSFLRLAKRNNPNLPAQNISEIHFSEDGELVVYLVKHPFPIYFGKEGIKRKYYQLRKVLEVLYRKQNGRAMIEKIAYIRMDYQDNKVLVVQNYPG